MQKHYSSEKIRLLEETYNIIKDCNNELAVKLIDSLEKLDIAENKRVELLIKQINRSTQIAICALVLLIFVLIFQIVQLGY